MKIMQLRPCTRLYFLENQASYMYARVLLYAQWAIKCGLGQTVRGLQCRLRMWKKIISLILWYSAYEIVKELTKNVFHGFSVESKSQRYSFQVWSFTYAYDVWWRVFYMFSVAYISRSMLRAIIFALCNAYIRITPFVRIIYMLRWILFKFP